MWFVLSTLNHPVSLQPVDRETNIGQTVDGTDPDESVMTFSGLSEKMGKSKALSNSLRCRSIFFVLLS
jgi:hypothetical protein